MNKIEEINVGMVGCGNIATTPSSMMLRYAPIHLRPLSHLDGILKHDGLRLHVACDINEDRFNHIRKKSKKTLFTSTISEKHLRDLSLLTIATRTKARLPVIKKALNMGVPALHIEKPLCNSHRELEELESLFIDHNTLVTYGTIRRFTSPYKHIKATMDKGDFGQHQQTLIHFGYSLLLWTHIHSIDLLNYFASPAEPIAVSAILSNLEYGKNDCEIINDPYVNHLLIEYSNGTNGVITQNGGMEIQLTCANGQVVFFHDGEEILFRHTRQNDPYLRSTTQINPPTQNHEGFSAAFDILHSSLQKNIDRPPYSKPALKSAIDGMKIVFTAIESHKRSGALTKVGDYPEDTYLHGKFGDKFA